jgi:hypothetical protein
MSDNKILNENLSIVHDDLLGAIGATVLDQSTVEYVNRINATVNTLTTERDQLRGLLLESLNVFLLTQRVEDYPAGHWCHRAQAALKCTPATEHSKLREALVAAHDLLAVLQRTIDEEHFYKDRIDETVGIIQAALKGTL